MFTTYPNHGIRNPKLASQSFDLMIQEPSGTVCSRSNKRTTGGGVLLDDSLPGAGDEAEGISETYICAKESHLEV